MTRAFKSQLFGVVLAGGQSARMGEDKAGLVWKGRTLLEHAESTLRAAGCDPVLVSGRPDRANGFADSREQAGPAHALLDALDQLPDDARGLLAIPVDMPLVRAEDLAPLANATMNKPCAWANHPLPLFLPATANADVREDVWSVRKLIAGMGVSWLPLDERREARLRNVNTPEDFAALPDQR